MTVEVDASTPGQLTINGRVYRSLPPVQVKGTTVELYRVSVLAAALGKGPQALILWERAGLLPKPMFTLTGMHVGHCKRWYSRVQILNLHRLWKVLPFGKGRAVLKDAFFRTMADTNLFYQPVLVNMQVKRGSTHERRQRQASAPRPAAYRDPGYCTPRRGRRLEKAAIPSR